MCFLFIALVFLPFLLIHARIAHSIITTATSSPYNNAVAGQSLANSPLAPAACPAVIANDTRILLLTVVQALHGSTALASIVMSSPKIATYCSGKTWQCEGYRKAKPLACVSSKQPLCMRDTRQLPPSQTKSDSTIVPINLLDLFSFDWNLTRPILHDKLFPREPGYTKLWEQTLARKEVSPQLQKIGVSMIKPVYVIMWTPLCVLNVAKGSKRKLSNTQTLARDFLQQEVYNLQNMKQQHQALLEKGIPVLVISYADLLFQQDETLQRLNDFLPCAGGNLNAQFVPQKNVDVFVENKWKVRGTVQKFASAINPNKCCDYDVSLRQCRNETYLRMFDDLTHDLEQLESYFLQYSM